MTSVTDLFNISPIPSWITDADTAMFLEVNEAAVQHFGYSRTEFLEMSLTEILEDKLLNDFQELFANPVDVTFYRKAIHAFLRKGAGHTIVEMESKEIEYNNRSCLFSVIYDITERIENESKLRVSMERFEIISKATSDTIWEWSVEDRTVTWNKGIKGIFGYKNIVNNITSIDWFVDCIHPDDRLKLSNQLEIHLQNKIPKWKTEYRFRCMDGSYKYVSDRGFVIFDKWGKAAQIIGAIEDITKRKEEEHWSKLLESVVINATDGVLIADADQGPDGPKIIYVNKAFLQITGYEEEDLLGKSPEIFNGNNTNKTSLEKLRRSIILQKPCFIELINYNKQRKEYWVSMNITPVTDSRGIVTHWISIQRDITENMKYIQAIEEQNKKFREIAWIQSHIVRAPLARVMGLVDLLKLQKPGDETDVLIEHLTSSAKDLDSIIINIADKMPTININ